MTLGERIRYFREQSGFTQNELASRSKLHPVSIRKYETNKMVPQLPQIEKIAGALNISPNTLIGLENSNLKLETVGDFMSILCILLDTEKLIVEGERKEDGFLKSETVRIRINDTFITDELLNWEKMNNLYNNVIKGKDNTSKEAYDAILTDMQHIKEKVSMQIQRSKILLDRSDGLKVKMK